MQKKPLSHHLRSKLKQPAKSYRSYGTYSESSFSRCGLNSTSSCSTACLSEDEAETLLASGDTIFARLGDFRGPKCDTDMALSALVALRNMLKRNLILNYFLADPWNHFLKAKALHAFLT